MNNNIEFIQSKKILCKIGEVFAKQNNYLESDIYVFLPKLVMENQNKYLSFPIFIKEQNKYRLIAWRKMNIESLKFKSAVINNIYLIDNRQIDFEFKSNEFKNLVCYFKKIFNNLLNKKVKNNSNIESDLNTYLKKLKMILNDDLFLLYFNIKKTIVDNGQQTNGYKKINNKEIKEELNHEDKKNEDSSNVDKIENIYLQEICEDNYSVNELLEKFSNININKDQKYIPEIDNDAGLKFVSDKMLDIVYNLLKIGKYRIDYNDPKNKERVVIYYSHKDICNEKNDTELLEIINNKNEDFSMNKEIGQGFRIENDKVNFKTCIKCKYSKCPYVLSAIIINYLIKNELEKKLKEREEFRKNNFKSNYFEFEWTVENELRDIPDDTFDLCLKLVENDFIKVLPNATANLVKIYYIPITCYELELLKGDFNNLNIKDIYYDKKTWFYSTRSNKQILKFCKNYTCNYSACIFSVAGYIYYLKRMGLDYKIIESRKYYKENKEKIDLEIDKLKQEAIEQQKKIKEEIVNDLRKYSDKILNIDSLINNITLANQNQFHMTLEGNDFKIVDECAEIIKNVFYKLGKFNSFERISLQNLAAKNVVEDSSRRWIYNSLENEKILIINGLKEFINDYKLYKNYNNSSYKELRIKQFNHVLDLLTNLNARNYIIMEGTTDEINELFELDNALKFVFQGNRYIVSETSIEEMYQAFLKNLNPLLRKKAIDNNSINKSFVDYIALNKEYMPFSNIEISNYLSNYCNINNKLIFPENVYKKETVEESLSAIIGMDNIKSKVKEFEKFVLFNVKAKALGLNIANSNLHMVFTGNPGTGKTTIARIMAKMLYDLGLIKENKLVEVERKDLVAGYIGQTATKTAEVIDKAMGGVLFIDEAYSLTPKKNNNDFGAEAIATLIKTMEDKKGNIVCIFAGYKDEMKTFMDINPGIASRIGYIFDFPDYNTDELIKIFESKVNKMGFKYEKKVIDKIKTVFDYFIKRKSFGNGRFVDKLIQETIMRHAINNSDDMNLIKTSDIPDIEDLINTNKTEKISVEEGLKNIIGMQSIKEKLLEFEKYVDFQMKAIEAGMELNALSYHMVFTGNPGTGKTTIARIIAKMLFDMGVIKENKIIEVERKDLVAEYLGQTAPKTYDVIEKAMGGVLFIDEAYTLAKQKGSNDVMGAEAIATLIKAMEDYKSEFVVIFAGYRDEMKSFLDTNPGIRSRIGYSFDFPDYLPEELVEIFKKNMNNMGFNIDEKINKEVLYLCEYFSKRKDFGNGRFIDKVIQAVLIKHSKNLGKDIKKITVQDIPTIEELNNTRKTDDYSSSEMISNLIGMEKIKNKLKDFEDYTQFVKEAKEHDIKLPNQNMHMIFTGNPGTGKTTVARIIAKMLFEMGIIHENKLIEVERKDLIAGYIGQTAPKTYEVIEKAMGGVLFIDEAYSLAQKTGANDNFGEEAITTLIKAMEDHKGEFIVIFAGYRNEMQNFMNLNPGISSRIGYVFDFEDYTVDELCEIFYKNISKIGFVLEKTAKENVHQIMNYFHSVDNIGNGRFVDKVIQETIMKHSKNKNRIIDKIIKDEIPTINEMTSILINGDKMIDVDVISEEELYRTAVHEIGHATLRYFYFKNPEIKTITINAEGNGALGYVSYKNNSKYTHSKRELLNLIDISLAGIASEQVFLGFYENGGTSDLEKATNIAKEMITRYGMGNHGLASISSLQGELEVVVFNQINEILEECFNETLKIIEDNKAQMKKVIDYLFKHKEINEETFIKLFSKS